MSQMFWSSDVSMHLGPIRSYVALYHDRALQDRATNAFTLDSVKHLLLGQFL